MNREHPAADPDQWPDTVAIYRVGGAVRDRLLGITPKENDWVVVGGTPEMMIERGYRAVGKDFPVFLHPQTNEEYALARTERKSGHGYTGFTFHASPDISIEQDLERRDLTVNAVAENEHGHLVDPFGGAADIKARVLRHVSPSFIEDPLRVLRVAKFSARFSAYDFSIAPETLALMQELSASGELDHLVPERTWQETREALLGPAPHDYFRVLRDCGALAVLFPEVDALFGVPQPEKWHPEIDTGIHTLMSLEQIVALSDSLPARYATLVHDLGKGTTSADILPSHHGHEDRGIALVEHFSDRLRVPNDCRDVAIAVCRFHTHVHRAKQLKGKTFYKVLEQIGALRQPGKLGDVLAACEADARGRTGLEADPYPQADLFRRALAAAQAVTTADIDTSTLKGPAIGEALRKARIHAIESAIESRIDSASGNTPD